MVKKVLFPLSFVVLATAFAHAQNSVGGLEGGVAVVWSDPAHVQVNSSGQQFYQTAVDASYDTGVYSGSNLKSLTIALQVSLEDNSYSSVTVNGTAALSLEYSVGSTIYLPNHGPVAMVSCSVYAGTVNLIADSENSDSVGENFVSDPAPVSGPPILYTFNNINLSLDKPFWTTTTPFITRSEYAAADIGSQPKKDAYAYAMSRVTVTGINAGGVVITPAPKNFSVKFKNKGVQRRTQS